jgi:hypothetical protein
MSIPEGTRFHGVHEPVDTANKGSELANSLREAYTIDDIASYTYTGTTATLEPEFMTVTPGGSSTITTDKNIVDLTWSGGSGTHTLTLPSATAIPYRFLRIVNNSTVTAQDKVDIYAPGTETIDGQAYYRINKEFNGIAVWSDGSNWIVIQAKST